MPRASGTTATALRAVAWLLGCAFVVGCAATSPRAVEGEGAGEGRSRDEAFDAATDARNDEPSVDPKGREPSGSSDTGANSNTSEIEVEASDAPPSIVSDEMPYLEGARTRAPGSVNASSENENIARWNRGGLGPSDADVSVAKPPHPAPRVKVDVLKVVGRVVEADVLRVARSKGYWPYRLCFEEGLRRDQKLHGSVTFRVTLDHAGVARTVRRVRAELSDDKVVKCVFRETKGMALPRPAKGAPQITIEVSFWPGDEPVYAGKPATAAELDLATAQTSLRAHIDEVRACYADGHKRHPGLWGRLALRLRLVPGRVWSDASEIESRFPDPAVTSCVLRVFRGTPGPDVPRELVLVYPLRLGAMPAPDGGS